MFVPITHARGRKIHFLVGISIPGRRKGEGGEIARAETIILYCGGRGTLVQYQVVRSQLLSIIYLHSTYLELYVKLQNGFHVKLIASKPAWINYKFLLEIPIISHRESPLVVNGRSRWQVLNIGHW